MKRIKILFLISACIVISIILQACYFHDIIDRIKYEYEINDGKYLIVKYRDKYMYVKDEKTDYVFAHDAELKVITKNITTGELGLSNNFSLSNVMTSVIGGIDFDDGEVEINDEIYLMSEYKSGMVIKDGLNLNDLFIGQETGLRFEVNVDEPNTLIYDGNIYEIGENYKEELGILKSLVFYQNRPIGTITFDSENNHILSSKEKLFMIESSKKEADKIITLNFEAVYEGKDGYVVGVDGEYKKLIKR